MEGIIYEERLVMCNCGNHESVAGDGLNQASVEEMVGITEDLPEPSIAIESLDQYASVSRNNR